MGQSGDIARPTVHRIALFFYRLLWVVATPLLRPYLEMRARHGKEDMSRLGERKGISSAPKPTAPIVWIHGASVGESMSALPLIDRIIRDTPELSIVVTTGTVTSAKLMEERLPQGATHQYVPLDHPIYIKRFLNHWQPVAAFWLESEFWPNLIVDSAKRGIPLGLLNGRMSERSFRRWRRQRWAIEPILRSFQVCHGQDSDVAEKLTSLGASDVLVCGNLKMAASPLPDHIEARETLEQMIGKRPVWLAAQTAGDEEEVMARVHRRLATRFPGLLTILAPRHPDRGDGIETALKASGLRVARRSSGERVTDTTDIYLADTMGELGVFFRVVEIVFLGRSLAPGAGGSNCLEPARLNCAILQGPHTDNFSDFTEKFTQAGAISVVSDEDAIAQIVSALLENIESRETLVRLANDVAKDSAGILELVSESIAPLLPYHRQREGDHAPS